MIVYQRALRSPSGLLRSIHFSNSLYMIVYQRALRSPSGLLRSIHFSNSLYMIVYQRALRSPSGLLRSIHFSNSLYMIVYQRALRSPSGLLRVPFGSNLVCYESKNNQATIPTTFIGCEPKGSKGRPESPLEVTPANSMVHPNSWEPKGSKGRGSPTRLSPLGNKKTREAGTSRAGVRKGRGKENEKGGKEMVCLLSACWVTF